jgi:uncharacterized protein (TIGR03086 family)
MLVFDMSDAGDPLALLERAIEQTGTLISHIRPDQANLPTPCSEWDVRALVNHVVHDLRVFTTMLSGGERGSPDVDLIDDDWSGAYQTAADALMNAWHTRGVAGTMQLRMGEFPATWAVGQHLSDLVMHTWDIASATGQSASLDPALAGPALDWARDNLKPQFRGQAFGPEREVPENAPIYDRLAGFFGRNPG